MKAFKSLGSLLTTPCLWSTSMVYASHQQEVAISEANGFLDVTKPPFNVDNTAKTDTSNQLQAAINHAHAHLLVAYVPHGEYLLSKGLDLQEKGHDMNFSINVWSGRYQPNVLMGARAKVSPEDGRNIVRPTFVLKNNTNLKRCVVSVYNPLESDVNFNQLFRGIDVRIGDGNPEACGVNMAGAQGSSVQDVTVWAGQGAAGITGGVGDGGSNVNVRVVGGRVGLDYTSPLNVPTTASFTLEGQTEAAIRLHGCCDEAGMFVGGVIKPASSAVPVIRTGVTGAYDQASFVDTVIEYPADGGGVEECVAFDTTKSLDLKNVWVKNCKTLIHKSCGKDQTFLLSSPTNEFAVDSATFGFPVVGRFPMPVYVDGKEQPQHGAHCWQHIGTVNTDVGSGTPSAEGWATVRQHQWDESAFPTADLVSSDLEKLFDVKSYGAKGDGKSDDTAAIQKAFDDAAVFANGSNGATGVVFVPKGFYRVSSTLKLNSDVNGTVVVMGAARYLSVFQPMSDGFRGATADDPQPLLHVLPGEGQVILTLFIVVTWEHLDSVWGFHWENKNASSVYRQNWVYRISECYYGLKQTWLPPPLNATPFNPNTPFYNGTIPCKPSANLSHPVAVMSGSGRFHNYENEDFLYETASYRHLLVLNSHDVHFYQLNLEHSSSEADLEVSNSSNIHVYGFKTEARWWWPQNENPAVGIWVRNSQNFNAYSLGGNGIARPRNDTYPPGYAQFTPSLYRAESTCPLRFSSVINQILDWTDPRPFAMIFESYGGVNYTSTDVEKPSLYLREKC